MKTLFTSLIKAQRTFPEIPKNKKAGVGSYSYDYADLAVILEKIIPVLAEHGLAITQTIKKTEGVLMCATVILHESGEQFETGAVPVLIKEGSKMQEIGGAITYAKRYSLQQALGICAEVDLDGNDVDQTDKDVKDKDPQSVNPGSGVPGDKRLYAKLITGFKTLGVTREMIEARYNLGKEQVPFEHEISDLIKVGKDIKQNKADIKNYFGVK